MMGCNKGNNNFKLVKMVVAIEAIKAKGDRKLLRDKISSLGKQVQANTVAMKAMQEEMVKQNQTYRLELQKLIVSRFQNLPSELLNNKVFKEKLDELMNQILKDVKLVISDDSNNPPRKSKPL